METNEAPEKIILSADRDTQIIHDEWVINDYTDNIKVEYTRTDAFIEKAYTYWHKKAKEAEGEVGYYIMSCIEDFKKAMEE